MLGTNILEKIDTWLALWFVGYVCNTLAVSHTPCGNAFLHTCGWAALYMLLHGLPIERIGGRHWAYVCAALGLWQVAVGLGQLVGLCPSGHHLYMMTGDFFNPAPFGAFIAMMLVVVVATCKERAERPLGIAAFIMIVTLPAAWSRAALLAFAVCICIMYRVWVRRHWRWLSVFAVAAIIKRKDNIAK